MKPENLKELVKEERLIDNFLRLAAMNSPTLHEGEIADLLESDLRKLGFSVVRDNAGMETGGETGNIIATKKGSIPGAVPILLSAHMDTVVPTDGWGYRIEDGVIHSNGNTILGADDKAALASILEAMRVIEETGMPYGDIQVILSIAEEPGLMGLKHLDFSLITAKYAFVYDVDEPVGSIITSAPYHYRISAKIHGRSAHAGMNPEDGISAISIAAKAITEMKLGRIDEETTANIGIINGGSVVNMVPDICNVTGEARSLKIEKLEAQVQHMHETFANATRMHGQEFEFDINRWYDGYSLEESYPVVQMAARAAEKMGITSRICSTGGGSDANIFNAKGIPAVALGIGYRNAHSVKECIAVSELAKSTEFMLAKILVAADVAKTPNSDTYLAAPYLR